MSNHRSGIVFDDPVSSLDHKWRYRVAKRLVKEGKVRQVLIFTHDIVFLLAVQNEAAIQGVPLKTHALWYGPLGAGMCDSDNVPWEAKNINSRLDCIDRLRKDAELEFNSDNLEKCSKLVLKCYDLLRKSWERAIEEILFNKVILRFGPEIKTQSINGVSVEDEDYKEIYISMSKCSEIASHDISPAINKPVPLPDELRNDIASLRNFIRILKDRRNITEKRRHQLLKAPPARIK